MVVRRGINEDSVVPMARHFRERGHILRFIEYMDVGHTNGWRLDDVVPAAEIVAAIDAEMPLEAVPAELPGRGRGPLALPRRQRRGRRHRVGHPAVLPHVHARPPDRRRPALHVPVRVRGHDLRAPLRAGETDAAISDRIRAVWGARTDRYSEIRSAATVPLAKVEMSHIGG